VVVTAVAVATKAKTAALQMEATEVQKEAQGQIEETALNLEVGALKMVENLSEAHPLEKRKQAKEEMVLCKSHT